MTVIGNRFPASTSVKKTKQNEEDREGNKKSRGKPCGGCWKQSGRLEDRVALVPV